MQLRRKSERLTMYLELLLKEVLEEGSFTILTPEAPQWRGCQLSLRLSVNAADVEARLDKLGVTVDVRRPNIIRVAPTPLYNSFSDVHGFVHALKDVLSTGDNKVIALSPFTPLTFFYSHQLTVLALEPPLIRIHP